MRFCVLGGGSKGNSTFLEAGATKLLIDAGFSGIEIERRLAAIGVDITTIDALFITHEHSDHIRGAAILSRRHKLPVFANPATYEAAGKELERLAVRHEFATGASFVFRDFQIHPFSVSHDAADPVGFLLAARGKILGYCTDTGVVSRLMRHRLSGCHGLVLECNHDAEMLKSGPYPPHLKQRVRSRNGHLANSDAVRFLLDILHEDLRDVVLSHISETNNSPDMVRQAMGCMLAEAATRLKPGARLPNISLARQDRVGEVISLGDG